MGNQKSRPGDFTIRPSSPSGQYLKALEGHMDAITCMKLVDKVVYTGSRDGTIRAWSVKKGDCVREFSGHTFWIECLEALSPNWILSGSADSTIRAWDRKTGNCVQIYKGHTNDVTQVKIAGKTLFSSSRDNTVKSWDVEKGEMLKDFVGHTNWIESFQVVNSILYTASFDGTARAWNAETGECTMIFDGHTSNIQCLLIHDFSDSLYTGSWDDKEGQPRLLFEGHHDAIVCIKLVEGKLFTGSKDNTLRRWDTSDGKTITSYRGHLGPIKCFEVDGNFLLSGSIDNTVRLWYIESGECIKVLRGHTHPISCLLIIHDGFILSGSDDKRVLAWKVPTKSLSRSPLRAVEPPSPPVQRSQSLPSSPFSSPPLTARKEREVAFREGSKSLLISSLPALQPRRNSFTVAPERTPKSVGMVDVDQESLSDSGDHLSDLVQDADVFESKRLIHTDAPLSAVKHLQPGFARPRSLSYDRAPQWALEKKKERIQVLSKASEF